MRTIPQVNEESIYEEDDEKKPSSSPNKEELKGYCCGVQGCGKVVLVSSVQGEY